MKQKRYVTIIIIIKWKAIWSLYHFGYNKLEFTLLGLMIKRRWKGDRPEFFLINISILFLLAMLIKLFPTNNPCPVLNIELNKVVEMGSTDTCRFYRRLDPKPCYFLLAIDTLMKVRQWCLISLMTQQYDSVTVLLYE